jgi:hypothetical protein
MLWHAFLRLVLGLVSRIAVHARPLRAWGEVAVQPFRAAEAPSLAIPHQWIRMANVLTGSSRGLPWETLERPNPPLGSIYRFVDRLVGLPRPCPVLSATAYRAVRQSLRARD